MLGLLSFHFPHPSASHRPARSLTARPPSGAYRPNQTPPACPGLVRHLPSCPSSQDPGPSRPTQPLQAPLGTNLEIKTQPSLPTARRARGRGRPHLPTQVSPRNSLNLQPRPPPSLSPPPPAAFRGRGCPCPQTGSRHADTDRFPTPLTPQDSGPPRPSSPRGATYPRAGVGEGEAERAGRGRRPGRLSAPGGRGRGQRRRSVSPRRRRRRPTPADTHRLHCPPAPPPFRLPSRARPFPPLGPPPAAPRHEMHRPPLLGRERSRAPPPGRDVPPEREGAAPPRLSPAEPPGRARPRLRECHSSPPGTRAMVPTRPLLFPSPVFPERPRPSPRPPRGPAHHPLFTRGPPTAGTTPCFAWSRPLVPSPVSQQLAVTPTPHLKAAEPFLH